MVGCEGKIWLPAGNATELQITPSRPLEQLLLVRVVGDLEIVKLVWGNSLIWFSAGKPRRSRWRVSRFTTMLMAEISNPSDLRLGHL